MARSREAMRRAAKGWKKRNPEAVRQEVRGRQKRRQEWLNGLKTGPCADCGHIYPVVCMDWDHVRGVKLFGIGGGPGICRSQEAVLAEIAKCDLVCANCHRIRTQKRRAS